MPIAATFSAGQSGEWRIDSVQAVQGETLPMAEMLTVAKGLVQPAPSESWALRGQTSNLRYTNRSELLTLEHRQAGLGRAEARCAALIPIRKSEQWWDLAQDERREIIAQQSQHIVIGLDYLPAISRRLFHCRDLGEPFDFLTWFEFAPQHTDQFNELTRRLRESREWSFVDHEVDIRLVRAD